MSLARQIHQMNAMTYGEYTERGGRLGLNAWLDAHASAKATGTVPPKPVVRKVRPKAAAPKPAPVEDDEPAVFPAAGPLLHAAPRSPRVRSKGEVEARRAVAALAAPLSTPHAAAPTTPTKSDVQAHAVAAVIRALPVDMRLDVEATHLFTRTRTVPTPQSPRKKIPMSKIDPMNLDPQNLTAEQRAILSSAGVGSGLTVEQFAAQVVATATAKAKKVDDGESPLDDGDDEPVDDDGEPEEGASRKSKLSAMATAAADGLKIAQSFGFSSVAEMQATNTASKEVSADRSFAQIHGVARPRVGR